MADARYRITERLGSGGITEVFKGVAESPQGFRKTVAVKRLLPALAEDKTLVTMFLEGARLSLAMQHANIVQAFDLGHADGTPFLVMEYVDGVDLGALMEWRRRVGKRMPFAHSLLIISELCKGLSYAHELIDSETGRPLGIVHGHVSPTNVLISRQGEVKVADFGLAKGRDPLEIGGLAIVNGNLSYLSPEAAHGEEVGPRADLFAAGILLYELLSGKRLFLGETDAQTVELVRNPKIPPLGATNPQVEPELEDIVRKLLAKRGEDRYQSAIDIQDALAHYGYSHGLKVIARDLGEVVRQCLENRTALEAGAGRNIVDLLVQEELQKFTSVDFDSGGSHVHTLRDHTESWNFDSEPITPVSPKATPTIATLPQKLAGRRENPSPTSAVALPTEPPARGIFLCYRRADTQWQTDVLGKVLRNRFGKDNVFQDVDSIPLGTHFPSHIERTLQKCSVFLAMIGSGWLAANRLHQSTDLVRVELETALRLQLRVIPVLVDSTAMPDRKQLPAPLYDLPNRQAARLRGGRDSDSDAENIAREIQRYWESLGVTV